ncbi:MAG: hypothetical protein HZA50_17385 [Planctomycetes bacterium]|nr:hypothetical protein [Planctomycetota bacterium]
MKNLAAVLVLVGLAGAGISVVLRADDAAPKTDAASAPASEPAPPNITVECKFKGSDTGDDSGDIVGTFTNNYDYPLASVTITIQAFDGQATKDLKPPATVLNVPPKAKLPFHVAIGGEDAPKAHLANPKSKVVVKKAPADQVLWVVSDARFDNKTEDGKTTIRVVGKVRNTTGQLLMNVKLYCDFYTGDGQYAGSAEGKPKISPLMNADASDKYEVILQETEVIPDNINKCSVRAIGQTTK